MIGCFSPKTQQSSKDYKGSVSVGKIEEFHAKLEQIGSDRTKGAVAVRNEFQESCLEYAQSVGMMLVRILPPGTLHIICDSTYDEAITAHHGLLEKEAALLETITFGMTSSGEFTTDLFELITLEMENILS